MKQRAPLPKAIVHDGLPAYDEAFKRELGSTCNPRIMDVRSIGSNEKGLNPKIERLNGTVRDRETVMRGLDTPEAATKNTTLQHQKKTTEYATELSSA